MRRTRPIRPPARAGRQRSQPGRTPSFLAAWPDPSSFLPAPRRRECSIAPTRNVPVAPKEDSPGLAVVRRPVCGSLRRRGHFARPAVRVEVGCNSLRFAMLAFVAVGDRCGGRRPTARRHPARRSQREHWQQPWRSVRLAGLRSDWRRHPPAASACASALPSFRDRLAGVLVRFLPVCLRRFQPVWRPDIRPKPWPGGESDRAAGASVWIAPRVRGRLRLAHECGAARTATGERS